MANPPDNLPRYRVLTGPDDETLCLRVSEALDLGYVLHGGPSLAFNGATAIVAQAVVWPETATGAGRRVGFAASGSAPLGIG